MPCPVPLLRPEVLALQAPEACGIIGVMGIVGHRNWTAQIVIASSHGGLRPHFRSLEEQILHVLARIDDPWDVMRYLAVLRGASKDWLDTFNAERPEK